MKRRVAMLLAGCCLAATAGCSRDTSQGLQMVVEELELPVAELVGGIQRDVEFPEAGYRLIEVSQDEADVQIKVGTEGDEKTWDAPARRSTPERACFHGPAGTQEVTLISKQPVKASNARLRLRIWYTPGERSAFPSRAVEAECLEAQGGIEHARWDEPTAVEQAKKYEHAARLWQSLGNEPRAADAYLQSSWMLSRRSSQWIKALQRADEARKIFRRTRNSTGEAQAALAIAVPRWVLTDEGRDETGEKRDAKAEILARTERELLAAIEAFDAAQDAFFAAEARGYLASNYFQQGRLREATQTFAEAGARYRATGEIEGATRALINMNVVLNRAGNYRDTAAAFDQLLHDRGGIGSDEVLADILNNSASTHSAAGHYSRALPQFVQAMQIHERTSDLGGMARSLNGLASTYMRLGVPSAALVYAEQARGVIARRGSYVGPGGDLDELSAYRLSGNAQRALGDFAAARAAHETALHFAHNDYTRAQAQLELLRDALDSGDLPDARQRIKLATPLPPGATRMQSLQWDFELARMALLEGRLGAAIATLRSLEGKFAAAGGREFEIEVLQAQALAEFQRGHLQGALALTTRGLKLLDDVRLAVGDPELRARLTSLHRAAYELRVEVLESLRAATPGGIQKSAYLVQMLAAADDARAGLVHESAGARALSNDAANTKELREVAAEIAFREHLLSALETGTAPGASEKDLRAELSVLRTRYDSLTPAAALASPEFGPDDYRTGKMREGSGILLFLSSKQKLRRYWLTRRGVQELSAADIVHADRLLPDANLLAGHRRLIIVADSSLAAVPFAAAKVGGAPLVAEHDLVMALTLRDAIRIAAQPDQDRNVSLAHVAVFFDPVFTPYDSRVRTRPAESSAFPAIARLSGSASEARAIAAQLRTSKVQQFGGFAATRDAALSSAASQASVLHFATHAIASDQWPNGSGLLLTGFKETGEPISGFLSSLDLLARGAATELVVLSACDTARGDKSAAENVAGLARAFLGGGARRVVATRWAVDDKITARLMSEFYAGLAAGKAPAEALSSAQRNIYSAAPARNDDTWSSFVLYERAPVARRSNRE